MDMSVHSKVDADVLQWLAQMARMQTPKPMQSFAAGATRKGVPRMADTYRGARRNAWRASYRKNHHLKKARQEMGISRRDLDRLRYLSHQLNVKGAA